VKFLVVGGNRFLGAEIVSQALRQGHEVTLLALDSPRADVAPHVRWLKSDRNDPGALAAVLAGLEFDAVIDNIAYKAAHVETLARELSGRLGRYVLTSSADTYGADRSVLYDEVADEKLEPFELDGAPTDEEYARGKRACERAVRALACDWAIVRPAVVVGRNDPILPQPRSLALAPGIGGRSVFFPVRVADGGPILIREADTRVFQLVWVQDVARAFIVAATDSRASRRAWNAAGDEIWTSERLVRALAHACGRDAEIVRAPHPRLEAAGLGDYKPPYQVGTPLVSNARLRALGWAPSPAEAWLPKLMEPFHEVLGRPFAGRRLQEIALGHQLLREHREALRESVRRNSEIASQPSHRLSSPAALAPLAGRFDPEISRRWAGELSHRGDVPDRSHFRRFGECIVGSIGLGTHRGKPTDEDDALYLESIRRAVRGGINLLDTAINYRGMRSERIVGRALRDLEADGIPRAAVCVVTKGGFVTADAVDPRAPARYIREEFVDPGLLARAHAERHHSIAPAYLEASLARSLHNLGLEHVDVFLLHNPERAREVLGEDEFYECLTASFAMLENRVREGRVGAYGIATWTGLRVGPRHPQHVSLERIVQCANEAASGTSHFRFVELPLNASQIEAGVRSTQTVGNASVSALEAAQRLGLTVLTSASLMGGEEATAAVLSRLPPVPPPLGVAASSLQLVRSVPAVGCALAGMRQTAHVEEALAVARLPILAHVDLQRFTA
jgi:aryl-alcohol dehydrogenase-like predicted oxidoreductase/nucleoside-diphosphate-sugar epimerase